jgi:hypothetical protein
MFRVGQIDLGRKRPGGRDKRVVWDLMIEGLMMESSLRGVLEVVSDMIPDSQCLSIRHKNCAHWYRVSTSAIPPFDIRISSHFSGKGFEDGIWVVLMISQAIIRLWNGTYEKLGLCLFPIGMYSWCPS